MKRNNSFLSVLLPRLNGKRVGKRLISTLALVFMSLALLAASTVTPVSATEVSHEQTHVVRYGDTLSGIASQYGTSLQALVTVNRLADPNLIVVGQRLIIPVDAAESSRPTSGDKGDKERQKISPYSVRAGDTLGAIARRHGVTLEQLAHINHIANVNLITVGQKLLIPHDHYYDGTDALPLGPLVEAEISPSPAVQGRTVTIHIVSSEPVSITMTFDGREIPFQSEGSGHWALLGIHAMQPVGFYPITIRAQQDARGKDTLPATYDVTLGLLVVDGDFRTLNIVFPPSTGKAALLDPKITRAEQALVNAVYAERGEKRLWEGRFDYPLAGEMLRVTSSFGERRSYNGGPVSSYHDGVDFGAPEGTPVYAPAKGIVALAEPLTVRGKAVIIDHGLGIFTGYWHLSDIQVETGQRVKKGDLIAAVGNTGLSTGPHLHWELRVSGIAVDPLQWVEQEMPG